MLRCCLWAPDPAQLLVLQTTEPLLLLLLQLLSTFSFFVLRSAAEEAEFAQRLELIKADAAQKKAAGVRNQFDAFHLCQLTLVPTTHSFYPPIHCSPILCLHQHLLLSLITLLLLLLPLLLPPLPLWTAAGALPAWHSRQCLASAGR